MRAPRPSISHDVEGRELDSPLDAASAAEEPSERYRALLDSIDDGFCIIDVLFDAAGEKAVDYRFVELNASFARQSGLNDAVGKRARELVPDLDAFWFETYGEVAKTGKALRVEHYEPAMQRWFDVQAAPVKGRRVALLFRDVTTHREAEKALRRSEESARQGEHFALRVINNLFSFVGVLDTQGTLLSANEAPLAAAGLQAEDVRGRPFWDCYWWNYDETVRQQLRLACARAAQGETVRYDVLVRMAGDTRMTIDFQIAPLYDDHGCITHLIPSAIDISERKKTEAALRDADRRKDEFIAILAHELRNPLAPVRNAVEIMRRIQASDARLTQAREVIDRQVTHMARLIDDLLDVSRITQGRLALRKERCDLRAIVRQTSEDYRGSLEGAGLKLVVEEGAKGLVVEGDPVRLAQMIGNLLHNAGRFTERGGRVEVRIDEDRDARCAEVHIRDTGVGIEAALLSRIFDPLSQADQDLARSKGGMGLGLSLTKGIAELHGGTVRVASEGLGRGSVFTLRIPLCDSAPLLEFVRPAKRMPAGGLRILVIEDNEDAAETLGELLALDGHEVELAFEGPTGIERAQRLRPQVVISDLGLPGDVDGYALARALRADPSMPEAYLIALSGYTDERARQRSREAGFDVHLAKPLDIRRLEQILSERQEKLLKDELDLKA